MLLKNVRGLRCYLIKKERYMKMKTPKDGKKKELEAILQKMTEADAVLLEWSD